MTKSKEDEESTSSVRDTGPSRSNVSLPPPSQMDIRGNVIENWQFFKLQFENYSIATGLVGKDETIKVATFLSVIGKDCLKIYCSLDLAEDKKSNVKEIIKAFDTYFQPEKNVIYERYVFGSANQEPQENIEQYVGRLRHLASTCNYDNLESELIRDRLVLGVTDLSLRKKLLEDSKLTLTLAIDICRAHEATDNRLKKMSQQVHTEDSVNKTQHFNTNQRTQRKQGRNVPFTKHKPNENRRACMFCNNYHEFKKHLCPAFNKICSNCGRKNHFAVVCKSNSNSTGNKSKRNFSNKKVHLVQDEVTESDSESLYKVELINLTRPKEPNVKNKIVKKQWLTKLTFYKGNIEREIKCQLDTGSTCNILHIQDLYKMGMNVDNKLNLRDTDTMLKCFNGDMLKPVGQTDLQCRFNNRLHKLTFQVVDTLKYQKPLISAETCELLKLISVNATLCKVQEVSMQANDIISEFQDVFNGLGRLPGLFQLKVDPCVTPVKNAPRRVSIPLRRKLEEKIDELEGLGVIKRENDPTEWISNIVVVMRNDKMRICLDPRDLNLALMRPHYQLPTIDDILPDLAKAKIFSVLDAQNGFWQVELDEESSKLTTFWTPQGRYRWTRMPFGIAPASEEFQRRLHEILYGLTGVAVIADDILCYGCGETEEEAIIDHDKNLRKMLLRAREANLKLNKSKLKLRQKEVAFMGHILSNKGLRPDTTKVQAISEMKKPQDVKDIQRFLGFVNYLAKFVPSLSEMCEPLRQLTRKDVPWTWDRTHDETFSKIKKCISNTSVLKYYNVKEPVTIQCDASSVGLGATLLQNGQPIAYSSRTLSSVERRYAQIEKECLAILFSCNRFHHYISGKADLTIETDHQPLISIFKKSLLKAPRRLQSMLLKLQKYNFKLEYKKGTDVILADTLSRAAASSNLKDQDKIEAYQVHLVEEEKLFYKFENIDATKHLNVTDQRLKQIKTMTSKDKVLTQLSAIIGAGWPSKKEEVDTTVREYWNFRDELVVHDGIVFRGNRLVIPKDMRHEMLKRIHSSHQGIEASLRKARESLYWPRMSEDIKHDISQCSVCLQFSSNQPHMPMQTHEVPDLPWKRVALDILTYKQKNFLLIVDYYSDFWEIDTLSDTTSETLISVTKQHFSRWGIPKTVVTDNAPNFVSSEWTEFAKKWEFEHITSSPYHPRGNGKAEATVKIAKSLIKKTERENSDIWLAILEWRNTPTVGINTSPVQRIMSRRTRSLIPMSKKLLFPQVQHEVPKQLTNKKMQYKLHYDKRSRPLHDLEIGQGVVVKSNHGDKTKVWNQATVKERPTPRSYIIQTPTGNYRRNREWLKPSPHQERNSNNATSPKTTTKTEKQVTPKSAQDTETELDSQPSQETVVNENDLTPKRVTRSGRTIRTPERFKSRL